MADICAPAAEREMARRIDPEKDGGRGNYILYKKVETRGIYGGKRRNAKKSRKKGKKVLTKGEGFAKISERCEAAAS